MLDDEELDTLEALSDKVARLERRIEKLEAQFRDEGLSDDDELDELEY